MNFRRKSKLHSEVSTHSLNDIMFFLLLFFLIASTMANPNVIKVLLPKAANKEQQVNRERHVLTLTKDKDYYINKKPIPKDQVKMELERLKGTNTETTVVLNIDASVPWGDVVELLDIGKEINVKMVAATEKK